MQCPLASFTCNFAKHIFFVIVRLLLTMHILRLDLSLSPGAAIIGGTRPPNILVSASGGYAP